MRYLHTMLRVSDVDASLGFYRDLLGLREANRIENASGRFTLTPRGHGSGKPGRS